MQIRMKYTLASFPIEVTETKGEVTIKFFPKNPNAKYPDKPVLVIRLDGDEKDKLLKILVG